MDRLTMTTMTRASESRRMVRAEREASPVVARLTELAQEFDDVAEFYSHWKGEHNNLLHAEAKRSASQLRLVTTFIINGTYSQMRGADWLRAGWRIINAIGRSNIR